MSYNKQTSIYKPESVLVRAEECVSVGKPDVAVQLIFDMLTNKRTRYSWQPLHETVMIRYIQLCMSSRNSKHLKEGLHQYRNITQQSEPQSLQKVVNFLINEASEKVNSIQSSGKEKEAEEDLDNERSPERILLDAVTPAGKGSEEEDLLPWLRFLWESFRTVLELLKYQNKLEQFYHVIARKALDFCRTHERRTEFRRLCELLRNHLTQKLSRNEVETSASTALELETRFEQLKISGQLRVWQEGFKTLEDIQTILNNSYNTQNKRPSSKLLAVYYSRLAQLFLISKNFLFHAYASKALYLLSKEKEKSKSLTSNLTLSASTTLLAALSIPLQQSTAGRSIHQERIQNDNNRKMAQLLGFEINPRRKTILNDLVQNKNILNFVYPEVKEIYSLLELPSSFQGLSPQEFVSSIAPLFQFLKSSDKLMPYLQPLKDLLVIRVLSQLSRLYSKVNLQHFYSLFDLQLSTGSETADSELLIEKFGKEEIERLVVKAVKNRQIDCESVSIDHRENCISFGVNSFEESHTKQVVLNLAHALNSIRREIKDPGERFKERHVDGNTAEKVAEWSNDVVRRREIILTRKEDLEEFHKESELFKQLQRSEKRQQREREEEERLERERKQREQDRLEKVERQTKLLEIMTNMQREGVQVSFEQLATLNEQQCQELIAKSKEQNEKTVLQQAKKLMEQKKNYDASVRLMYKKMMPKVKERIQNSEIEQKKQFEADWLEHLQKSGEIHQKGLENKERLTRVKSELEAFRAPIKKVFEAEFKQEREAIYENIQMRQRLEKLERARKKLSEVKEEQKRKELLEKKKRDEEEHEKIRAQMLQGKVNVTVNVKDRKDLSENENDYDHEEKKDVDESGGNWRAKRAPQFRTADSSDKENTGEFRRPVFFNSKAKDATKESERPSEPTAVTKALPWQGGSQPAKVEAIPSAPRPRFFNSKLETSKDNTTGKSDIANVESNESPKPAATAWSQSKRIIAKTVEVDQPEKKSLPWRTAKATDGKAISGDSDNWRKKG